MNLYVCPITTDSILLHSSFSLAVPLTYVSVRLGGRTQLFTKRVIKSCGEMETTVRFSHEASKG